MTQKTPNKIEARKTSNSSQQKMLQWMYLSRHSLRFKIYAIVLTVKACHPVKTGKFLVQNKAQKKKLRTEIRLSMSSIKKP